jgi:hypothetical protein
VPDKQLSAKKPLPIGFLPRALCRELRSAKALPRAALGKGFAESCKGFAEGLRGFAESSGRLR